MNARDVGKAALAGWRETVADRAAPPVAARTAVEVVYVAGAIKRALEA